jgi:hypothetical protein
MAAQDMTDALKHPHPDVPFATIGDETIMALTTLASIFKNKFQKPLAPEAQNSPLKAAETKRPAALIQQALTSPVRPLYQEGGHTSSKERGTSEGAGKGAQYLSQELVPGRLPGHGKCKSCHSIWKQSLDICPNDECGSAPSHRERNAEVPIKHMLATVVDGHGARGMAHLPCLGLNGERSFHVRGWLDQSDREELDETGTRVLEPRIDEGRDNKFKYLAGSENCAKEGIHELKGEICHPPSFGGAHVRIGGGERPQGFSTWLIIEQLHHAFHGPRDIDIRHDIELLGFKCHSAHVDPRDIAFEVQGGHPVSGLPGSSREAVHSMHELENTGSRTCVLHENPKRSNR